MPILLLRQTAASASAPRACPNVMTEVSRCRVCLGVERRADVILGRERRARIGAAHRRVEDARVFRVRVAFRIFEADAHAPVALALLRQHAPHQIGPR
ncbi:MULTISPECIES: hypothetical protein [Burkholderia]|uniref:hypothetical protein n=1 Tax=Burkholderia TaxID=32008 RepID=UPI0012BCAD58|nr:MULTISPECIES: hypothetical protein [Burkholderia]